MTQHQQLPPPKVLILGAGEFGLTTAWSLSQTEEYLNYPHFISIIDKSKNPPSLDAASSDYNKIIRSDYSDPYYATLASNALKSWRSPEFSSFYFESGTVIASNIEHPVGSNYVRSSLCVNQHPELMIDGVGPRALKGGNAFRKLYFLDDDCKSQQEGKEVDDDCKLQKEGKEGNENSGMGREEEGKENSGMGREEEGKENSGMGREEELVGYFNPNCGWADARKVCEHVCEKVRKVGVQFHVGEVSSLIYSSPLESKTEEVIGVQTVSGETIYADKVIVALGAWSSKLLPELLGKNVLSTGQYVGHIQLTKEETELYKNVPVTFFLDSGFYLFPPTSNGILKVAIHGPGYLNFTYLNPLLSTPRTFLDYPNENIPKPASENLRKELKRVFPKLVDRDWESTRLCWYTDSPTSNFLISPSPSHPNSLLLATAGSGHGFKFLPILGDLIVGILFPNSSIKKADGTGFEEERERFGYWNLERKEGEKGDGSRGGLVDVVRDVLRKEEMEW